MPEGFMASYSIKLVDHISTSTNLRDLIKKNLQKLFDQVFANTSDSASVDWGAGAKSDSIVLHFAQDIAGSYLEKKWPGQTIDPNAGGHTHYKASAKCVGSEFYKMGNFNGKPAQITAPAMARLAFHEALHNRFPTWTNAQMHGPAGGGGLAAKPAGQTLTTGNISL